MPSTPDLTDRELEQLYEAIDRQIDERGLPTDAELFAEIERLNRDEGTVGPAKPD